VKVGAIPSVRKANDMTVLKTGAATWPPKWPRRGFCKTTSQTTFGLSAGAMPTKDAV